MPTTLRGRLSRKSRRRKLFDAFTQIASFAFAGIFMVLTLQVAFPDGMATLIDDLSQQPKLARHALVQEFHAVQNAPITHKDDTNVPSGKDIASYSDLNNIDV